MLPTLSFNIIKLILIIINKVCIMVYNMHFNYQITVNWVSVLCNAIVCILLHPCLLIKNLLWSTRSSHMRGLLMSEFQICQSDPALNPLTIIMHKHENKQTKKTFQNSNAKSNMLCKIIATVMHV